MNIHRLEPIFNPERIALIGVTPNPKSVGGFVLRNLVGSGYRGAVYPVNPNAEAVLGMPCYPDLDSIARIPDLAILCSPAEEVPDRVSECGAAGVRGIIIMSAGFGETGKEGRELEERIRSVSGKYPDMRIIGPNCLGIISPHILLNASFAGAMPRPGSIAFISQSGALCTSILDWALEENIGFSHFVSIGNSLDVDFADLIDYFGEDEKTKAILLYIESIRNARKFISAARAFARGKPIVAYKAGRFPESAEAAASHTGALAGQNRVYEAAFQRAGIVRVFDIGEIFDCAELVGRHRIPRGHRLGIVTNAGGPGVMATDALIELGGSLSRLTESSIQALNECLPPMWSHRNPVDILGDAKSRLLGKAVRIVLNDVNTDALLVILTPQAMTNPTAAARTICELSQNTSKPILAAWLGGHSMREGIHILNQAGIATFQTPEKAIRAFMTLVVYARNLEVLYETPREIHLQFALDRNNLRSQFLQMIPDDRCSLTETESKSLLQAYGIPVTMPLEARSAEEAVQRAEEIGYPVVLKILSGDITHKTDTGGVALNLGSAGKIRDAYRKIIKSAGLHFPEARITGVTVQKMINRDDGLEMILGMKKDPVFGSVILVGLGGTAAEIFDDHVLGFPPLNERLARWMLESLKLWPLLKGYRGRNAVDLDHLLEILIRFSYLVADYPEIAEIDINPLFVSAGTITALDARIIIDQDTLKTPFRPFSHLALRPYPEELVRQTILKDGTRIVLRPIKPEDEPLWLELLSSCSRESIYARFRYFFHWDSHEVAIRYCYNDYDREIAIVAELAKPEGRKLLGVGRLIADPGLETAEYAVLVTDKWQDRGLGSLLTDYCEEIAIKRGFKKILAQTTSDNIRMVELFRRRGYRMNSDGTGALIEVEKDFS
ncbi:bifunctional acetate--CoA ligase family protein/GNAT family N-acetyltransferase [bacterium]|nr:bifunctional acetate--CoA ligase family protein/GNAT family N-acetyltransferase [candidate division CSSED10-310 bacterium]